MYPELFRIPVLNIPIFGYGLMMVFAFLATQWLSGRLAKSKGIDPEIFVNVTLFALIAGVIGSRLSHVLENLPDYTRSDLSAWQNFVNMINIRSGGLTFYGGVILAAPVVLGYVFYRKVPARLTMDIVAPCLMLGLAIGRIGCFLNGCCYGAEANVPWAVRFPYGSNAYVDAYDRGEIDPPPQLKVRLADGNARLLTNEELQQGYIKTGDPQHPRVPIPENARQLAATQRSPAVHPAQLYSTFNALLITVLLLAYFSMPHVPGRVFALMLMLEGPTRFILEMLRVEPPVLGPMSLSMVIGAILFVAGAILWIALGIAARDRNPIRGFPVMQRA
jgi:phosphatidylglycerol:prolipoprotein diacylglycerol transferase